MVTVGQMGWYWASSFLLAVLLFFPASKMIWVSRVRRTERKLKRLTTEEERQKMLRSSRMIAAGIVVTFAFLFNRVMFPVG